MTLEPSAKLFATRDTDFDVCRSFLVVSMIFTHVFQYYYLPDYNRRLTFFVTIGFVFISGFVMGGRNAQLISHSPLSYLPIYVRRFAKIMAIYLVCNVPIIILEPSRLDHIRDIPAVAIIWMVLAGEASAVFAFDILPAIALTALFGWVVMTVTHRVGTSALWIAFLSYLALWFFEVTIGAKFIAFRLLFTGIFGCSLGMTASFIDWQRMKTTLADRKAMILLGVGLVSYFWAIGSSYWPKGPIILLWRHLMPTAMLLLFVYLLSYALDLGSRRWVRFLNATLSDYMLFAYIFHIGLIRLAGLFVKTGLNFQGTVLMASCLTGVTMAVCFFLDGARKRSSTVSKAYSAFFGL